MSSIQTLSPQAFAHHMISAGITREYIVTRDKTMSVSHPEVQALADWIASCPDYHDHEGIFFEIDAQTECIHAAFVHNTHRGAGQGGTRFLSYGSVADAFVDGMRLAEGMTYKNALAHLWWGGGKGVIIDYRAENNRTPAEREQVFANYGKFVSSLNGCYVTAEDMNTNTEDMRVIHANCRHCTCIPQDVGGSGNPSPFTARGVHTAMKAAIHFLEGKEASLAGKHVAVQGAGHVGYPLIEELVKSGARVTVSDMNPQTLETVRSNFSEDQVTILPPERGHEIVTIECDIFSPCAIGAIVNEQTIPNIKAKIIAGAANNQLKDPVQDAAALKDRGILYLPDYVINRMGIVNCANEMYGYIREDIEAAIDQVYPDVTHILEEAKTRDIPPFEYADIWAKEESMVDHPVWGHRGKKIVKELMENGWEKE